MSTSSPAFIPAPQKIPLFLRLGLWIARKITGKDLLPARLLAWYPKAVIGSGVLEGLIAHHDGKLDVRILKLVRMAASFAVACPFCVDMNSAGWEQSLTRDELAALQGRQSLENVASFTDRERLAVRYSRLISSTPLTFPQDFIQQLTQAFTEREIVILATTAAQVNYWARLIQGLGCPPAGFTEGISLYLPIPEKEKLST